MMKRVLCLVAILICIGVVGVGDAAAQTEGRGFGFGGPMAMAFFPDMSGINTFLSENGLPSMGSFLIGAGGGGRGGVIGGPAFGGIGWGVLAASEAGELRADFVFAGGGFDIGAAIGGDESSVLTIGAVVGGGANVLSIFGYLYPTIDPEGLVPEPMPRELGRSVGFVQPYVSMAAQLLPWMGFELRIGYVLPVFGIDFGDQLGIPAPSLDLSGPTVSLGIAFGGIGSADGSKTDEPGGVAQVTSVSEGAFAVDAEQVLVIENTLGDIVIAAYAAEATQTASDRVVEWQATRTCSRKRIDELQVVTDVSDAGATVKTVGPGRVDYLVRIPTGIDLTVRNETGNVTIVGHEAQTIIIENGVGEVDLHDVRSLALIVAGGVGVVDLADADAHVLIVELGIGEISLVLPGTASAAVTARARIGEVTIDRFPGMIGGVRGFLGESADVRLGSGERTVELTVGLGRIGIEMGVP